MWYYKFKKNVLRKYFFQKINLHLNGFFRDFFSNFSAIKHRFIKNCLTCVPFIVSIWKVKSNITSAWLYAYQNYNSYQKVKDKILWLHLGYFFFNFYSRQICLNLNYYKTKCKMFIRTKHGNSGVIAIIMLNFNQI